MKLLQRVSKVRYQVVEVTHEGDRAMARVVRTFNDDRGYTARRLIAETKRDAERLPMITLDEVVIIACVPVTGGA